MKPVVKIHVQMMWESCERTTYYPTLTNNEGQTITPQGYATGSVYTDFVGLTKDEARDRALFDAGEWADFFGLELTPYEEDGTIYQPNMIYRRFAREKKNK